MTDATFDKIQEIHAMGMAILLVEQNVSRAASRSPSSVCGEASPTTKSPMPMPSIRWSP